MKRAYSLEIPKLKPGVQHFTWNIDSGFFEDFPDNLVEGAAVEVKLKLEKTPRLLDLRYQVAGAIQLSCDRCLEPYWQPVDLVHRVIYSFDPGLEAVEDEDVFFISTNQQRLDLSQDFYDLISLQVPFRKVPEDCPRDTCPPEVLAMLKHTSETEDASSSDLPTSPEEVDARWEVLRRLKNS